MHRKSWRSRAAKREGYGGRSRSLIVATVSGNCRWRRAGMRTWHSFEMPPSAGDSCTSGHDIPRYSLFAGCYQQRYVVFLSQRFAIVFEARCFNRSCIYTGKGIFRDKGTFHTHTSQTHIRIRVNLPRKEKCVHWILYFDSLIISVSLLLAIYLYNNNIII